MSPPFLAYLTVFKARLGVCNILLGLTSFAHQPSEALTRRLVASLDARRPVRLDAGAENLLSYFHEKRLITNNLRKSGRYKEYYFCGDGGGTSQICDRHGQVLDHLPVFATDLWLADPKVSSTIGLPTPENASECVDLAFQLRLLTKSKNTWTPAGHLISALRELVTAPCEVEDNPFVLNAEGIALLRQVLSEDGVMMLELARTVIQLGSQVSRDLVAGQFEAIAGRAVDRSSALGITGPDLRSARDFHQLIRDTKLKAERKVSRQQAAEGGSRKGAGPGVLEHRVAPRLEWLTDLGYLNKDGLPKNGFEYNVSEALPSFIHQLEGQIGGRDWPDEVAVAEWRQRRRWEGSRTALQTREPGRAYALAYQALKRRIGPTPLREVAFLASLYLDEGSVAQTRQDIVEFAAEADGASLAGGRYSREPANIYMSDQLVAHLV